MEFHDSRCLEALLEAVPRGMVEMHPPQVATSIASLGSLHVPWRQLSPRARRAIHSATARTIGGMSSPHIQSILQGFEGMGALWSELPAALTTDLSTALERVLPQSCAVTVVSCLVSLGHLQVEWSGLSPAVQDLLLDGYFQTNSMPNKNDPFGLREAASPLSALSQMGVNIHSLPTLTLFHHLVALLDRHISRAGRQDAANFLLLLGQLKVQLSSLPESTRAKLMAFVQLEASSFRPKELAHVLLGLANMGMRLEAVMSVTRVLLLRAMVLQVSSMEKEELATALLALGELGESWGQLPIELKEQLLSALARTLPLLQPPILHMVLLSLRRLDFRWGPYHENGSHINSIFADFTSSVLSVLSTPKDLKSTALLLAALAESGFQWSSADPRLLVAIENAIITGWENGSTESGLVAALGIMGTPWNALSPQLQRILSLSLLNRADDMMEEGALLSSIGDLAAMGLKWQQLDPKLNGKRTTPRYIT